MASCRSCHESIMWAKTVGGKWMPLDAVRDVDGKIRVAESKDGTMTPTGNVIHFRGEACPEVTYRRPGPYVVHWSTCPNAAEHRRSR